jgi:DNA-binding response OmpR family regulator
MAPVTEKLKALIVEDEVDICFLLSGILRKKNLNTSFVNTLKEATKSLSAQHPSILVLDNNLPDGHGIDMIDKIKHDNPTIKIIMITADDTEDNKNNAFRAGVDFFIGKPFTRDTINRTLDSLLALPTKRIYS